MDDIVVEYITELVTTFLMCLIFQLSLTLVMELLAFVLICAKFLFVKVHKAQDIGSQRGKLSVEDFLYLIRKVLFFVNKSCKYRTQGTFICIFLKILLEIECYMHTYIHAVVIILKGTMCYKREMQNRLNESNRNHLRTIVAINGLKLQTSKSLPNP